MQPKAKREFFQQIARESCTVVFYESPHRVLDTLEVIGERLPDRQIARFLGKSA
ncbi:hypothetical protein LM602_05085 [Candidatus Acetothermia bacterium]|jgi:16S rRNA C1402 (ribose-2'-O) methylase RsmI|nr:hypothetical protein [Candidatus Acetothermia bacterium]MCI2431917.1 hypothetical protein [Candidatus Acetothermia bacterium]MCI2437350.1 hypothetical protein [Candidatus Acetothermia bacterium]